MRIPACPVRRGFSAASRDYVWLRAPAWGSERPAAHDGHLEVLLGQCEDYVDTIRRRSREAGVSVDLVFLLARIEQAIARLRQLRDLVLPAAEDVPSPVGTARGRDRIR